MKNDHPIDSLWAFLADDDTNPPATEGIVAEIFPGIGSTSLITGTERVVPKLARLAEQIASASGRTIRLVRFTRAEVVRVIPGGH